MGFARVWMIKHSSQFGDLTRHEKTLKSRFSEPGRRPTDRGERTNATVKGKINTKASEDTEGWRESAESRLTAAWGRRGRGQRRTRGAAAAKGQRTPASRRVGGWTAVRGMCSLNQVSPGAETERNTSLSREGGGGCWSGQALLFPPAPPFMRWEKSHVLRRRGDETRMVLFCRFSPV